MREEMSRLDIHEFTHLVQDFVEATSQLVSGRIINIMDANGIIVASTEKSRVGDFHQGAWEVIRTGKPVQIHKEDLERYAGSREGFNMPITDEKGEVFAVVGMFGEEAEVRDAANLLRVYVTQFLKTQLENREKAYMRDMRGRLLDLYLLGDPDNIETILQIQAAVGVRLRYPVQVLIADSKAWLASENPEQADVEKVHHLLWSLETYAETDIYAIKDSHLIWIHSLQGKAWDQSFEERLKTYAEAQNARVSVSSRCNGMESIPEGYKEAKLLQRLPGEHGGLLRMQDPDIRVRYFLNRILAHGGEAYTRELYEKAVESIGRKQMELLLETAAVYYRAGGSVRTASELLHIHKNTLQYRLGHLYEALKLEGTSAFGRELFIRMLEEWHSEKK